ncbi:MAG: hypothetical protein V4482_05695 [Pseudomonadota bacterium]
MNKNKILVACMATMLGSCAGFAMEFTTPVKRNVNVGTVSYAVSPDTADHLTQSSALILQTPALKQAAEASLANSRVPDRHKAGMVVTIVDKQKVERQKLLNEIHLKARESQAKIADKEERKKMLESAKKHKTTHEEMALALEEALTQKRTRMDELSGNVDVLKAEIEALNKQNATFQAEATEDAEYIQNNNATIAELTVELTVTLAELASKKGDMLELEMEHARLAAHTAMKADTQNSLSERVRQLTLPVSAIGGASDTAVPVVVTAGVKAGGGKPGGVKAGGGKPKVVIASKVDLDGDI